MRTRLLVAAAVVFLSASACDHGSGAGPDPGSDATDRVPKPAPKDVDPPTVVALVPAPGDSNVWVRAPITMTFSEPVDLPADRTVVLALAGGGSIDTTVHRSADRKSLTIVPDSLPPPRSEVTVNFRARITDLAGNAAALPIWWWIVPQWQQMAPALNSANDGYTSLELAAGPDGGVYVAHQFSPALFGFTGGVWVEAATAGAWTTLPRPPSPNSLFFGSPIVVGADGMPIVAQRGIGEIRIDRFDGTAWQPLGVPPAGGDAYGAHELRMVLDRSGQPVVAWVNRTTTSNPTIDVARWDGTAWTLLGHVPTSGAQGTMFDLAASAEGTISIAIASGTSLTFARLGGTGGMFPRSVSQSVRELSLAFDEDGVEVLAIIDAAGAVHVLRPSSTEYAPALRELGTSPSSAARRVAIRSRPNGRPGTRLVLSFLDTGPRVLGWTGERWESLAEEIATPTGALYTEENVGTWTLTVSPQGELIYAWAEQDPQRFELLDVFVVRYNE